MTDKQQKILSTALQLFAENGYNGTSTSKVAKLAGVSEGLIFRHFTNKEGLLRAIMDDGYSRIEGYYSDILKIENPKEVICAVICLPFEIEESQYPYWKLIYSLKWKSDFYTPTTPNPLKNILVKAFESLNYSNPEAESDLALVLMDGLATTILLKKSQNVEEIREVLMKKYDIG